MKALLIMSLFATLGWGQVHEQTEKVRPKFKKKTITVGTKTVTVEIADNDEKRAYGLMFVKKMAKDTGMLFVFDQPEMQSFWMKNTLIPLAIGYFDQDKKLVDVLEMEPASMLEKHLKTYPSTAPAKYALEMNKGWYKENKIKEGAVLKISK
jgi:uncharacterized protein